MPGWFGWGSVLFLGLSCQPVLEQKTGALPSSSAREWDDTFDQLENRLLWSQSRVREWEQLAHRRRQITEVACRNQTKHLQEMAVALDKQNQKLKDRRRRRSRLKVVP